MEFPFQVPPYKNLPPPTPDGRFQNFRKLMEHLLGLVCGIFELRESALHSPPWFESNRTWGGGGIFFAIVFTVVAAMKKDLRWMLILAWPFAVIALWTVTAAFRYRKVRVLLTVTTAILVAFGLYRLNVWLRPIPELSKPSLSVAPAKPPSSDKPEQERAVRQPQGKTQKTNVLTASALRKETLQLTKELRAFQAKADSELGQLLYTQSLETALAETEKDRTLLFQSHHQQLQNLSSKFDAEYAPLAVRASIIQEHMYRFLPKEIATPPPMVANAMGGGRFSGPSAAKGVADHLETLARLLPN